MAPRSAFGRLDRSPVLKPVDAEPVWSVNCFVIDRRHRRTGVATALLDAAVPYVRQQGGIILEGYPIDTGGQRADAASVFTGTLSMFERAGFREVSRRSPKRPIMRLDLR